MKIRRRDLDEEIAILELSGKVMGGDDADRLWNAVKELVHESRLYVVFDIRKVRWVNSTGLGILISAHTSLVRAGGMSVIANASDRIENVFHVTQLELVFARYPSVESAVSGLRAAMSAGS